MWVHFESPNVDLDGRIVPNNSVALRFEILDPDLPAPGNLIKVGGSSAAGTLPGAGQGTSVKFSSSHFISSHRVAEKTYIIRYYTPTGSVQKGAYSAQMTANFIYY